MAEPANAGQLRAERPPFARLVRQSGVYALGSVAVKASGLLLIPLYLDPALLSQRSFGFLVLLEATAQIAIPLAGLGISSGLLKFTTDREPLPDRDALPFTALVTSLAAAAAAALMLWIFAPFLADLMLDGPRQSGLIRLLGIYVGLKIVGGIPFMMVRAQERAALYVAGMLAETLGLVGGAWYFLAVLHLELAGVLWAFVLSAGAGTAILGFGMLGRVAWSVQPRLMARLVRFGAPLALAGLALPFLHGGDRYLLEWLADTEEVAVYGLAARYAGVLNMLFVQSFQLAFAVIGLKSLGSGAEDVSLYRRTFRHYVIWTGWAALALSLAVYDLTALISSEPSYLRADAMVLPLSIGYLFYGIALIAVNVLYATDRTRFIASGIVMAVVVNGLLNLALIPWWGGVGAAVATLISYAVMAGLIIWAGRRQIAIDYPWRALGVVLVLVVILYAACVPSLAWRPLPRIGWRLAFILLYPMGIIWSGTYSMAELQEAWRAVRERWSSFRGKS